MNILAIDPGSTQSAVCIVDVDTLKPVLHEKLPNDDVLESITHRYGKHNVEGYCIINAYERCAVCK